MSCLTCGGPTSKAAYVRCNPCNRAKNRTGRTCEVCGAPIRGDVRRCSLACSTTATSTRLPVEPLLRALGPDLRVGAQGRLSPIPEIIGTTWRNWRRWIDEGIPVDKADRVAVAAGAHPAELWGPGWESPWETVATDNRECHGGSV